MPATEAPAKSARSTWRDWMPSGMPEPPTEALLSRDELLEDLRYRGVDVSPRQLVRWQEEGIIPYGVRQWRDGSPTVLYPAWMVDVLRGLRHLHDAGLSLAKIRDTGFLRSWSLGHVSWRDPLGEPIEMVRAAVTELARRYEQGGVGSIALVTVQFQDEAGKTLVDNFFHVRPREK